MKRIAIACLASMVLLAVLLNLAAAYPPAIPESYTEEVSLTATGSAGAATGTVSSDYLRGYIKAIYIDYAAGISATTDITVALTSPSGTVMVNSDSATDAWFYPSVQFTGSDGSAVSGAYGRFPIDDKLSISAGQSTSGTVAVLSILYGDN